MSSYRFNRKRSGRYKARLVVNGKPQDSDPENHYSPTLPPDIILLFLSIVAMLKWDLYQIDVSTAFLHAKLDGASIYMHLPEGFRIVGKLVKLAKSLYGLKQAPRKWSELLHKNLTELEFTQSNIHPCIFYCEGCILIVFVDDFLISGPRALELVPLILERFPGTMTDPNDYFSLE